MKSIVIGDSIQYIPTISDDSIDAVISDIPYGINLDTWDVLHNNTNSALLGTSPAQVNSKVFKTRGKPINGWNAADKLIPIEYYKWLMKWIPPLYTKLKSGSPLLLFGSRRLIHRTALALEDSGFIIKDMLFWNKIQAPYRAQRMNKVLAKRDIYRNDLEDTRLGNLAPTVEPIIWAFKPYNGTITDNVLTNGLGAFNDDGIHREVLLNFPFTKEDVKYHEAQKPLTLMSYLIQLVTMPNHIILDPFAGSGTTLVAAKINNRGYIGIEKDAQYEAIIKARLN